MEDERKHLVVRLLELAIGITAIVAVVIFASVTGMSAYLAYQPSALEAQAVNIATSSAATTSAAELLYSTQ